MRFTPAVIKRYQTDLSVAPLAKELGMSSPTLRVHMSRLGVRRILSTSDPASIQALVDSMTVRTDDGCWLFWSRVNPSGYANVRGGYWHRIVYEAYFGPIPDGLHIDHMCHRRSCMNPAHLQLLTKSENSKKHRPGAFKSECQLRVSLGLPVHTPLTKGERDHC